MKTKLSQHDDTVYIYRERERYSGSMYACKYEYLPLSGLSSIVRKKQLAKMVIMINGSKYLYVVKVLQH